MAKRKTRYLVCAYRWNADKDGYERIVEPFKTLAEAKELFDKIEIGESVGQVSIEIDDGSEWVRVYFKDIWHPDGEDVK